MPTGTWPSLAGGSEYVLTFDRNRARRLLVVPALFDEANKLRRFTVETMRMLDAQGIDTFLPDLPGSGESLAGLSAQTLSSWREAVADWAQVSRATHVLAIRGGALALPARIDALAYAPVSGASLLRGLLRARVIADREAGTASDRDGLVQAARGDGIELAGYRIGAAMFAELEAAEPPERVRAIAQVDIGGPGLWLRAEPDHDAAQASALATRIADMLA